MTIEISNKGISGQPPRSDNERKAGDLIADKMTEAAENTATRKPVDSLSITDGAKQMQSLESAISNLPVVDKKRVDAAASKIENKQLGIMSNNMDERLKSAESIVNKLLDMEEQLPTPK